MIGGDLSDIGKEKYRGANLCYTVLRLAGVVGIEPTSKVLETPILPLNHTPKGIKEIIVPLLRRQRHQWCANRDSNPGPTGYEPVALTN